jgi:hypothetical protein
MATILHSSSPAGQVSVPHARRTPFSRVFYKFFNNLREKRQSVTAITSICRELPYCSRMMIVDGPIGPWSRLFAVAKSGGSEDVRDIGGSATANCGIIGVIISLKFWHHLPSATEPGISAAISGLRTKLLCALSAFANETPASPSLRAAAGADYGLFGWRGQAGCQATRPQTARA